MTATFACRQLNRKLNVVSSASQYVHEDCRASKLQCTKKAYDLYQLGNVQHTCHTVEEAALDFIDVIS